jgi:hypothetical protein
MNQLYRAWDEKEENMAYQGEPDLECFSSFMHHYGDDEKYNLMQWTGVVDKNGIFLFDGDLLGGFYEDSFVMWCDECKSFNIHMSYGEKDDIRCTQCEGDVFWGEFVEEGNVKNIEVIGNIFEGIIDDECDCDCHDDICQECRDKENAK